MADDQVPYHQQYVIVSPAEPQSENRSALRYLVLPFKLLRWGLAKARPVIVDLAVVLPAGFVLLIFSAILLDDTIVIDAPSVPQPLQERGVTPELLIQKLESRISEIHSAITVKKFGATDSDLWVPQLAQEAGPATSPVSLESAGVRFSITDLAEIAGRALGMGTRRHFTGTVVCKDEKCEGDDLQMHFVAMGSSVSAAKPASAKVGDVSAAIEVAARHLLSAFDPYSSSIYHYQSGDVGEAKLIASNIVRQHHWQEAWARNLLGVIDLREHHLVDARWHFDQALKVDPEFVPALVNLGNVYFFSGDVQRAAGYYARASALAPQDFFMQSKLGRALFNICDWYSAERAFQRAIELDSTYFYAYRGLAAILYWRDGDYNGAMEMDRIAKEYAPQNEQNDFFETEVVLKTLSQCFRRLGEFPRIADSAEVFKILPDHP